MSKKTKRSFILEVRSPIPDLTDLDSSTVHSLEVEEHVYLDGERVPPQLEQIILMGLHVYTAEMIDKDEKRRSKDYRLRNE